MTIDKVIISAIAAVKSGKEIKKMKRQNFWTSWHSSNQWKRKQFSFFLLLGTWNFNTFSWSEIPHVWVWFSNRSIHKRTWFTAYYILQSLLTAFYYSAAPTFLLYLKNFTWPRCYMLHFRYNCYILDIPQLANPISIRDMVLLEWSCIMAQGFTLKYSKCSCHISSITCKPIRNTESQVLTQTTELEFSS